MTQPLTMQQRLPEPFLSRLRGLRLWGFLAVCTSGVILTLDLALELGVAVGALYVAVIWMAYQSREASLLRVALIGSVALAFVGLVLSPAGGESWKVLMNRAISVAAIVATGTLGLRALRLVAVETELAKAAAREREELAQRLAADQHHTRRMTETLRDLREEREAFKTEVKERSRLEEELRQVNEQLEGRVAERTAALVTSNEALKRTNRELEQFAYVASHDLQTPLRTVASFGDILKQDWGDRLDEEANDYLGRIVDGAKRMQALIHGLLTLSRLSAEDVWVERVSLEGVFDDAVAALECAIRETGAEVTHDGLPMVNGDRRQLSRLLQSLIENGIKYRGEAPVEVIVSAEEVEEGVILSVGDNGVGIPAEHHQRVFEVFRRLHSRKSHPGTGIGLAICQRIAQRHLGKIWVESHEGKGCTVRFQIPKDLDSEQMV